MWKKFLSFFELAAYAVGAIGGLGYCLYAKGWVIAAAVVALAAMAFPEAKAAFKRVVE